MIALLLSPCLFGCAGVSGSAVATGEARAPLDESAPVKICALCHPDEGEQVGIVQAKGTGELEDLATEFASQVRRVGGNCGKVDSIRTKFETQSSIQTYTYSCGTPAAPATCTGSRTVTTTIATTQVLGRAFKLERP